MINGDLHPEYEPDDGRLPPQPTARELYDFGRARLWDLVPWGRRRTTVDVVNTLADSYARMVAAALDEPAPARPAPARHCPSCGDPTRWHSDRAGIGCRRRGCLCLETPALIRAA